MNMMEEWHQTEWWDKKVFIQNVKEEYTQITIAGPKARLLLEKLGGLKVDNVNFKFVGSRDSNNQGGYLTPNVEINELDHVVSYKLEIVDLVEN